MDILFENQYKHTKEYFKEIHSYFYFKKPILIFLNLLFILVTMFSVLSLFFPTLFPSEFLIAENLIVIYIFFPLFIWTSTIIRYLRSIKIRCNQELEINNGELFESGMIATSDGIDAWYGNPETKSHVAYSKIKKCVKTKNYYILISKSKLYCAFKKDGFVKGTPEEFLSFLRDKGFKC